MLAAAGKNKAPCREVSDEALALVKAAKEKKEARSIGVIGNCAYTALIDERARIVWSCLPRFDGDPVFNALLDPSENGSLWSFELENFERSEQAYEPNTAILKTRLFDSQGAGIEITDFAPRFSSSTFSQSCSVCICSSV